MTEATLKAARPDPWTYRALMAPSARYLAVGVMAASFIMPVQGLGVDLCILHSITGLPCPGCGMTRALCALSQGDLSVALALNPFALLAWPTFLVLALATLSGPAGLRRFEAWVQSHADAVARAYKLAFTSFVSFGALRLLVFLTLGERFP